MPIQFCTHIFPDHHQCGSPALRGKLLCYFHHPSRRTAATQDAHRARRGFTLTPPRDRHDLHLALCEVINRLAANKIDSRRAGLLLYSLQIAGQALES